MARGGWLAAAHNQLVPGVDRACRCERSHMLAFEKRLLRPDGLFVVTALHSFLPNLNPNLLP